jgi:hypothetical protein
MKIEFLVTGIKNGDDTCEPQTLGMVSIDLSDHIKELGQRIMDQYSKCNTNVVVHPYDRAHSIMLEQKHSCVKIR